MGDFYERTKGRANLFPSRAGTWREPQRGALASTLARWTLDRRDPTLVSIPTGTGKTAVAMAAPFLLENPPARILVVAPAVAIREQLVREFSSQAQLKRIGVLPEKSPAPSVVEVSGRNTDWDGLESADVVVALPQSISPVHYEDTKKPPTDLFDLVVVDEAHHAPSSTWRAILEHFDAPQLLLTATPRRHDGRRLPGVLAYYYPLRKALDEGFYKPIAPVLLEVGSKTTKRQSDELIAARAAELAKADEHRSSTLLVRAGSIPRLQELEPIYRAVGLDLTLLHSRLGNNAQQKVINGVREGEIRVVGVVGMLGEGFDLPSLRLLAYHDKYRSLPATVQLLGRLARVSSEFPQASALVTVADADVFPELKGIIKQLYEEDPDWTEILPGVLDEEVERERLDREFVADLPTPQAEVDPLRLEPLKRALVYEVPPDWEPKFLSDLPEELRQGGSFAGGRVKYSGSNREAGLLVVVVRYSERPKWSSDPILSNVSYELHLAAYQRPRRNDLPGLVLLNLDRDGLKRDFEEILGLDGVAELAGPRRLGDYLDSLDRISVSSVGIRSTNAATRGRATYRNFMGSGVDRGLRLVDTARSALGHVMMQVSTPAGASNAGAAVEKSKIWLSRYGSLRELSLWAEATAALLWYPRQVPQGPLLPAMDRGQLLEEWPESAPLAAEPYPGLLSLGYELRDQGTRVGDLGSLELFVNADPTGTLQNVGPAETGPLRMVGVMADTAGQEHIVWDAEVHTNGDIRASQDLTVHRGYSEPLLLSSLFEKEPPTVYFLDGSTTIGRVRYDSRASASAFDPSRLTAVDWGTSDISAETRQTAADRVPPQVSVHEHLEGLLLGRPRVGEHRWILCNDGANEIADYLVIEELASGEVSLGLWHAKGAGGEPSMRVNDFQVVAAQAIRSRRRFSSTTVWAEIGAALAGDSKPIATLVPGSDDEGELRRRLGYDRPQDDTSPNWQESIPSVKPILGVVQPGLSAQMLSDAMREENIPNTAQSLSELFIALNDMAVFDGGDIVILVSP